MTEGAQLVNLFKFLLLAGRGAMDSVGECLVWEKTKTSLQISSMDLGVRVSSWE